MVWNWCDSVIVTSTSTINSNEVMVRDSTRLDKMVQSNWTFDIADVLPTSTAEMTETDTTDTTVHLNAEQLANPAFYCVPGQYMYEDLLLGSGIPPQRIGEISDMDIRSDDVIVASYPKTGTTLLQEIVWLINHDGDVSRANKSYNYERILFIEFTPQSLLDKTTTPRHFKTHVPYRLLPRQARTRRTKVVYIMRNPKDVLVSYYHFYRMCIPLGNYKGTWNDFFQMFVNNEGKLYYGNMFDHMLAYWQRRNEPDLHIVFYEDILRTPHQKVAEIARFLEKDLTPEQVNSIVWATSFTTMKENPKTNWSSLTDEIDMSISPFMRRGVVGDWKEHFTPSQIEIFDRMASDKLRGSGMTFTYE